MPITKATASSIAPAAKGDLVVGSATNDASILAVGTNTHVLTADSAEATGLKWAAAAAGGANWSIVNSGGTALTGSTTITVSSISGADKLMVLISGASTTSGGTAYNIRFNSDSGHNYVGVGAFLEFSTTYNANNFGPFNDTAAQQISIGAPSTNAGSALSGYLMLSGGNASGVKQYWSCAMATPSGGHSQINGQIGGIWNNSATVNSVSFISSSGNFDAGTIFVYKSA